MSKQETIAIIPARGGSKRLPRKNVKSFCGHPLIAWTITQALCSNSIDGVYVTTDDDEIEKLARLYGAEVIRRPDWPDANEASANRPIFYALNKILQDHEVGTLVTMLPTNPLNKPDDLDKAIEIFHSIGADSLVPFIIQRETTIYRKCSDNIVRLAIFDKKYHYGNMTGAWCITTTQWFNNYYRSLPSDLDSVIDNPETWPSIESYFYPLEYWQYADVDTAEEFEFGELLMEHYILKGKGMQVYKENIRSKKEEMSEKQEEFIFDQSMAGNINQLDGGIDG